MVGAAGSAVNNALEYQSQNQSLTSTVLTLKAANKNLQQMTLIFFSFIFRRKYGLMFHVNPLPSRGFT